MTSLLFLHFHNMLICLTWPKLTSKCRNCDHIFAAYFLTSFTLYVYTFEVILREFFRCILKITFFYEFTLKLAFMYHLSWPKLINEIMEIFYVFQHIFNNVYMLEFRVIDWSFRTYLVAFSWIHLANNFHSNQPHYTSYEHHDLYKFVHVRIQT